MAESLLSSSQRRAMLEDIARIGLALGRSIMEGGPIPLAIATGTGALLTPRNAADTVTPLERLHLLERLWPGIETALVPLARAPRTVLIAQPTPVPLRRTRGGTQVAQMVARKSDCATAWGVATAPAGRLAAEVSPGVSDPLVSESRFQADNASAVNRFVGTFLAELEQEARHLAALAEFCAETDCADRAQRLAEGVGRWRARPPFAGLAPLTAPERLQLRQGVGAMQGDAAFGSLLAHWRTLRRPLHFDWSGSPLLFLPALEAWHLYEIWCFLTVAHCLRHLGWLPVGGWPVVGGPIHGTPEGLRLRLPTGRASEIRFRRPGVRQSGGRRPENTTAGRTAQLTLTYQPLFPSANRRPQQQEADSRQQTATATAAGADNGEIACASLTHDMQPDIALQWHGRLYLLDAKYRRYASRPSHHDVGAHDVGAHDVGAHDVGAHDVGAHDVGAHDVGAEDEERGYQALLEDVDKMHTYRDSIVRGARRAVSHAWCLWPGAAETDVFAYPAATAELPFGTAGIGALPLRPGDEPKALLRLLYHWLAS